MSNIAFIGLGQMGKPMASNLIKKGHSLNVYDINKTAISEVQSLGAHSSISPKEAVKGCEFIITMLPNGKLVENVIFGKDGIIHSMDKNSLIIDMSTIHPLESDSLRNRLAEYNIEFMDAPVGRTSDNAIAGTLLILAGGTPSQIERSSPILLCMGSEIINAGGPGKGIRVKLINNFMSISLNALSAEAATLCEALELPLDIAIEVMKGTPAIKSHFTTTWANKVLQNDLTPAFMIELAHKDLGIATDVANQLHVPLSMGAAALEIYNQARAMGRGKQDWTAILEQARINSGLKK
ncbi:sulfolactaldehyde 3-reductase [Testudinibacter aquarius]|uniref:Sulfolactaldehyde 3-reductase n=1 Tax=Testudinibacter aquarius TaxID=1524974 RepID=A0A4R3Y6T2_9PAST|nr:sulfolactaldehyde 3-reductase [Testudinibacter aquarius]KAE9530206.1 gamma-hydroxybutyrate dehydrogenase [Testudinibacter aquarius]TCV87995.1 4-hydroxybutyrate dehydrogenase/sulfolactaldehyde 3-reductase [Testudinibacter aquarius]TNG91760.1 sulfolactaldehyde 3-reductase [Testudinibacter aquarius]